MKWSDFPRDDLKYMDELISLGWTPSFAYQDKKANRITPENVPHFQVNYTKDIKTIWYVINTNEHKEYWVYAELIGPTYSNHKRFDIETLIKGELIL